MPKKKKSQETITKDKHAAKKALVLGAEKKSRVPLFLVLIVSGLLLAGGIFLLSRRGEIATPVAATSPSNISTTAVTYPVEVFDDGKARHFSYEAGQSLSIKYFVIKSSDGVIRAAFDACDVCWPAGKGYIQSGDSMVCRNCGRQFASVLVNEVKGGCNPAPLNRKIVDGKVVLDIADIIGEGKQFFNFSGRNSG
jgi:uncharacterized membrane protein